ncbi:MAG: DUF4936 family protein [Rhodocyclaceae bacterium]|nr:DUF4936 family protein [Rhodocyclaceae bacterium]MBX3670009.1 DUF4936 family protein [Rhodocyclaceae bacterium]
MQIDYYIYYRIADTERCAELSAALAVMQASLRAATGVAGRYRRRLDDASTWMEIYEGVTDPRNFEVELGMHVQRHDLYAFLLPGTARHIERFRIPG